MITTPDLIGNLAAGLEPAPRRFVARRLALGFLAGAVVTLACVLLAWGPRPDLAAAVATGPFWIKLSYASLLALAALAAVGQLARAGERVPRGTWLGIGVAFVGMAALAWTEWIGASPDARWRLVMGATAASCPWLIMLLALPVFAGALWAMRALAPVRLTMAGAAAGLAAGAVSAFLYAISCDESAMPFVLIWYGLGMIVPAIAGALLGRRLLRW